MSGAFETVAGAFAVVGVADVVIRSGREVCSFFAAVADAPNEVNRLRDSIHANTCLAEAAKECLHHLKNYTASSRLVSSFNTALKALKREVESLNRLLAKFGTTRILWSSIKYVLDDRKVRKALANLEASKTLLTSTLSLVCR